MSWTIFALVAATLGAPADPQVALHREAEELLARGDRLAAADKWLAALALALTDLDVQNHFCGAIGALTGLRGDASRAPEIAARIEPRRAELVTSAERLRRADPEDNRVCLEQWDRLAAESPSQASVPAEAKAPADPIERAPAAPTEQAPTGPPPPRRGLKIGLFVAAGVTVAAAAAALATGLGAAHDPEGGFQGFAYKKVYEAAPNKGAAGVDLCQGSDAPATACAAYEHTRRAFTATAVVAAAGVAVTATLAALVARDARRGRLASGRVGTSPTVARGLVGWSLALRF